jgi:hypothetical protein
MRSAPKNLAKANAAATTIAAANAIAANNRRWIRRLEGDSTPGKLRAADDWSPGSIRKPSFDMD